MRKPKLFFTADLHFGHENILTYTKRPYPNVDAMNDALVCNWNRVVRPEDSVIVLGDFAMGKRAETVPIGKLLNGWKAIVPGNHDGCWDAGRDGSGSTPSKTMHRVAQFREWSGFAQVIQPPTVMTHVGGEDGPTVTLTHLPPIECGDHKAGEAVYDKEVRFVDKRPPYPAEGQWMLCGHVHEAWKVHGRVINVGCDVWDYTPVEASVLVDIIEGRTHGL